MLCQFGFKNFRSYKEETVFDFQADNLAEMRETLIASEHGSPLLPVSAVYGPNGGGKSNLLAALTYVIALVVQPIFELKKARGDVAVINKTLCVPFAFDALSPSEPTEFNLYFRTKEQEYRYYISVLNDEIVAESLHRKTPTGKRTAMVFEREYKNIKLGAGIRRRNINTEVNPKMPYLSFLAINYDIPVIVDVESWFESCISLNYANPTAERTIPYLTANGSSANQFVTILNNMGIDISGFRWNEARDELFITHTVSKNKYELSFNQESDGTKKVFQVLPFILIAISEGRLIIIDELDSKLHPKLLRYIISLFTNPEINKHGAQLLFTSHDLSTMNHDVFRRDEIWFAALGENRSSELYSLSELRDENNQPINHTAAYSKQYLEGRYGADPYLQAMLNWEAI